MNIFNNIKLDYFKTEIPNLIEKNLDSFYDILINFKRNKSKTRELYLKLCEFNELDLQSNLFFNLLNVIGDDLWYEESIILSEKLNNFSTTILFDKDYFNMIEYIFNNKEDIFNTDDTELDSECIRQVTLTYRNLVRGGSLLSDGDKKKYNKLINELTELKNEFSHNVLKATDEWFYHTTNEDDLIGLSETLKNVAKKEAENRGLFGYVLTLKGGFYNDFMITSKNRNLRKLLFKSKSNLCLDGKYSNKKIIKQISKLRYKKAKLLNYDSWGSYVLEDRMLNNKLDVLDFLSKILNAALPQAETELKDIREYAYKIDKVKIKRWDVSYYSELLKNEMFSINDNILKPYLNLEKCLNGLFLIINKLYDIEFVEENINTYHSDVRYYKVLSNGSVISHLYLDLFERKNKKGGAWMTDYIPQSEKDISHIQVVCNFIKSDNVYLCFSELTTLFHEFGHALHGILSNCRLGGLSGTSVVWDFVELPSQIMENWCYEAESLNMFATNDNDETIPKDIIDNIKKSQKFLSGLLNLRQVQFGLLDYYVHTDTYKFNPINIEKKLIDTISLWDDGKYYYNAQTFSHIFSGSYSMGYYSYKWSEVLDCDAFNEFEKNGIFNKDVADRFKVILSSGNTKPAEELFKDFKGSDVDVDSFFKKFFN